MYGSWASTLEAKVVILGSQGWFFFFYFILLFLGFHLNDSATELYTEKRKTNNTQHIPNKMPSLLNIRCRKDFLGRPLHFKNFFT